jgi:hypothetical protein
LLSLEIVLPKVALDRFDDHASLADRALRIGPGRFCPGAGVLRLDRPLAQFRDIGVLRPELPIHWYELEESIEVTKQWDID